MASDAVMVYDKSIGMCKTDISIVIVNYNSGGFLYDCIKSIVGSLHDTDYEVIVVDNASSDDSLERCRIFAESNVVFIDAGGNLGFSKANNLGARHAHGRILHLLNPDTRIDESMNSDYAAILAEVDAGNERIYCNRMQNRDGSYMIKFGMPLPSAAFRRLIRKPIAEDYFYVGATVILPASLFERIGRWNEAMFMYCEDVDMSYKAYRQGIEIKEMPAIVYHYGGGSSEKAFKNVEYEALRQISLRIFYRVNNISMFKYWALQVLSCVELVCYRKYRNIPVLVRSIVRSFAGWHHDR